MTPEGETRRSTDFVFAMIDAGPDVSEDPTSVSNVTVYGTAFSIGAGCFMTAHHVFVDTIRSRSPRLAVGHEHQLRGVGITDVELFPDLDMAILRADVPTARGVPFASNDLNLLEDVQAMGYPYAIDETRAFLSGRAFKGHVVAAIPFTRLPGHPNIYELSFLAPRGLSGAPLWYFDPANDRPRVVGMIIGNRSTEMLVFSSRERIDDGHETIVERFEALQLGVAIRSTELLRCESRLLGGTLFEHLNRARGVFEPGRSSSSP